MGVNKLISIKVPVLEALQDMGIDHAKNVTDFVRWAARAEKMIGSYYSYRRKVELLVVDNFRAELPCDAAYVKRVLLGDHCDRPDLFDLICGFAQTINVAQTDTFLVIDKPENVNNLMLGHLRWEIQDNHIVFSQKYDKQKITIQYLGLQNDSEGFPMVCENHVEAIIEYIMFRYAKRSRFSPIKIDMGDVQLLQRNWQDLAAGARADDAELSEADRDEITAMISDPLIGFGLSTGYVGDFRLEGY